MDPAVCHVGQEGFPQHDRPGTDLSAADDEAARVPARDHPAGTHDDLHHLGDQLFFDSVEVVVIVGDVPRDEGLN
jgi:hypothetical protein